MQARQELNIINKKIEADLSANFLPLLEKTQALNTRDNTLIHPITDNVPNMFQFFATAEMPLTIFSYLDKKSLLAARETCTNFKSLADDKKLDNFKNLTEALQKSFKFLEDLFTGKILDGIQGINDVEAFKLVNPQLTLTGYQKLIYNCQNYENIFASVRSILTFIKEYNDDIQEKLSYFDDFPNAVKKIAVVQNGLMLLEGHLRKIFQLEKNDLLQEPAGQHLRQ
jgi:hypothetical protein